MTSFARKNHMIIPGKLEYAQGKRPDVECIICSIVAGSPKVKKLIVYRDEHWWVSLNIYPYNPGHIMIFPVRHMAGVRDLKVKEKRAFWPVQQRCLDVLERTYKACGFNIGVNEGRVAGASINHLHYHIVPRYPTEVGFMDLIGESRVIVEDPKVTQRRLARQFKRG